LSMEQVVHAIISAFSALASWHAHHESNSETVSDAGPTERD